MSAERNSAELRKLLDEHPRRTQIEAIMNVGTWSGLLGWPATVCLAATMLADPSPDLAATSPVLVIMAAVPALLFAASFVLVDALFYEGSKMTAAQRLIVAYLAGAIMLGIGVICASFANVAVPPWLRMLSLGLGGVGVALLATYFMTVRGRT